MKEAQFVNARPNRLFFKHILRKIFLEDWLLKLSAIVITVALWFGVSYSNKKGEARMPADVAFRVSDNATLNNATLTSLAKQDWTVKVSGDDRKIADLYNRRAKIPVTVDLTDQKPGDLVIQVAPESVTADLPTGVKLDDIQPSRVAVSLEPLEERELPVRAEITGQPAPGFEIYSTTVMPARVGIRGPQSYVDKLDFVPTEVREVTGSEQDLIFRQVPISLPNSNAAVFNTVVDVAVHIGEKRIERSLSLSTASGKRITAVLYGPTSSVAKIKPTDLKVEIVKSAIGEDEPRLTLPDSLKDILEIRSLKLASSK